MDLDSLTLNTRVVKESRGICRIIQLLFAIIAFSTVVDFYTSVGINITCPHPNNTEATVKHQTLNVAYPFDFSQQVVENGCEGQNLTYKQVSGSLSGSPQFFVMTGVLSFVYASGSLFTYLVFTSSYQSLPVMPVADLIITAILCLFWFIASSSFSSGVSILKTSINYSNLDQTLCPGNFTSQAGANCSQAESPAWKSLNVGLVSGFTSFFLWGAGLWFVYKETHFHTPRDQFGTR